MRFIIFFCVLFWTCKSSTQAALLQDANAAFKAKDYIKARQLYLDLQNNGFEGPGMYHNLGLCASALNNKAESILYLEKAIKFAPNQSKILQDLNQVRNQGESFDTTTTPFLLLRIFNQIFGILSPNQWIFISLLCLIFVGTYLVYHFPINISQVKKLTVLGLAVLLFLLTSGGGYYRHHQIYHNNGMVIMVEKVELKMGPDKESPDVSELELGAKVYLIDVLNTWMMVTTEYGEQGWIPAKDAAKI